MNNPLRIVTVHKVRRTRKAILISYTHGDEEHPNVKFHENPLPAFTKAMDDLAPVLLDVLHLPDTYGADLKLTGVTFSEISGNPAVTLIAQKSLAEANGPFNICTPLRLLDLPSKEGSYSQPLTQEQAAKIEDVRECAKAYVLGERAQGTITFKDDGTGEEPAKGQELPFPAGSTGKPARKQSAAAAGK